MNIELLREWLSLPPGDWPPDHYSLIGLEPGTIPDDDPSQIEELALDRMECLRRHQIRHQDEVTEGMNRLALAMACLSDRISRRAYDISIGLADETPLDDESTTEAELDEFEDSPESEELIVLELVEDQPPDLTPESAPDSAGEPVLLEFSNDDESPDSSAGTGEQSSEPLVLTLDELELLEVDPAKLEQERRQQRRELYAGLAKIRATMRIWEQLRPYLKDHEAPITTRADVQTFTSALASLSRKIDDLGTISGVGEPGQPGYRVVLLCRHHLALQTFRGFLPSQRLALSEDWQNGWLELRRRKRLLREEVRGLIHRGWRRRVGGPWVRKLVDAPEWMLIPASLAALVIALWRS